MLVIQWRLQVLEVSFLINFLYDILREEKSEQLVDTRHEVDQLVLELQKIKQEVRTWKLF